MAFDFKESVSAERGSMLNQHAPDKPMSRLDVIGHDIERACARISNASQSIGRISDSLGLPHQPTATSNSKDTNDVEGQLGRLTNVTAYLHRVLDDLAYNVERIEQLG